MNAFKSSITTIMMMVIIVTLASCGGGIPKGTDKDVQRLVKQLTADSVINAGLKEVSISAIMGGKPDTIAAMRLRAEKDPELAKAVKEIESKINSSMFTISNIREVKIDEDIKKRTCKATVKFKDDTFEILFSAQRTEDDVYVEVQLFL